MVDSRYADGHGAGGRDEGVVFPLVEGRRSSTATGRAVFADAARAADAGLAEEIAAERAWRKRYLVHVRRLLETCAGSGDCALAAAEAGLASLHRRFDLGRDGSTVTLAEAHAIARTRGLRTIEVRGEGTGEDRFGVRYRGELLRDDLLHRQLDRWIDAGTVEPSFADAIRLVMANPDWLDLSDHRVVLLGAGAEMSPLPSLCRWGAHILPVDLPRPEIWRHVLGAVRQGRGRARIPVPAALPADIDGDTLVRAAGADLVTDLPEVTAWLDDAAGADGPLTLANYVYADGAAHVRVAMAVDAVAAHLGRRRDDLSLAVLATPTDVFAVDEDAVAMAQQRFAGPGAARGVQRVTRGISGGRLFAPNYPSLVTSAEGLRFGIADCLVTQQGPNYALAKALQRWRATVARHQGRLVSINVAPPTRTRSVLKNRALAAAYAGAHRFGVEVFDPATSSALMAALLVHDLRNPSAAGNPRAPLAHPLQLLSQGAGHGGLWRIPFAPRSVLGFAVALGMVRRRT
ncbi:MAG: hypothetical protein GEU81_08735 [Nitriliruptorales bacterium]|nr:hypothetical protein [Nitriliruptorales bacterium]